MFWGVNDVIETRTCTCSARGYLNTNDRSGTPDKYHITLSQCPWCVWLHDNRNAREWLEVTEFDREQVGLMVSLIRLRLVHSAMSSSTHFQAFFVAFLLSSPLNYSQFAFVSVVPSGPCGLLHGAYRALSNFLALRVSIYSLNSFHSFPFTFITF